MNVNIRISRFGILRYFVKCVFLTMRCSNGEGLSELYLELVYAYTKRFMPYNGQVAVLKCSPIWKKMRKSFEKLSELKSSSSFPKRSLETGSYHCISWKRNPIFLMKKSSNSEVWSHGTTIWIFIRTIGGRL